MGKAVERLSWPIALAAVARSFKRATSCRSMSSILCRQSSISMPSPSCGALRRAVMLQFLSTNARELTGLQNRCTQALDKSRDRAGRLGRIGGFDQLYNRGADHCRIGKLAHGREMLRVGDAEAHRDRQIGILAQTIHKLLRVRSQVLLGPGNAGP